MDVQQILLHITRQSHGQGKHLVTTTLLVTRVTTWLPGEDPEVTSVEMDFSVLTDISKVMSLLGISMMEWTNFQDKEGEFIGWVYSY